MNAAYTPLCNSLKHVEMNSVFFVKIIDNAYECLDKDGNGKVEKSKLTFALMDMAKTLNITKTTEHDMIIQIDELFPTRMLNKEAFRTGVMGLLYRMIKAEMQKE